MTILFLSVLLVPVVFVLIIRLSFAWSLVCIADILEYWTAFLFSTVLDNFTKLLHILFSLLSLLNLRRIFLTVARVLNHL